MANEKTEPVKQTLRDTLDAITFKNEQFRKVKAMQEDKEKLKDSIGKRPRRVSSATQIKGLQGLQGLQKL